MNEVNLKSVFSTNKKKIATIARNDKKKEKNKSNGKLFHIFDINCDENSKFSLVDCVCCVLSPNIFIQYQYVSIASVNDAFFWDCISALGNTLNPMCQIHTEIHLIQYKIPFYEQNFKLKIYRLMLNGNSGHVFSNLLNTETFSIVLKIIQKCTNIKLTFYVAKRSWTSFNGVYKTRWWKWSKFTVVFFFLVLSWNKRASFDSKT